MDFSTFHYVVFADAWESRDSTTWVLHTYSMSNILHFQPSNLQRCHSEIGMARWKRTLGSALPHIIRKRPSLREFSSLQGWYKMPVNVDLRRGLSLNKPPIWELSLKKKQKTLSAEISRVSAGCWLLLSKQNVFFSDDCVELQMCPIYKTSLREVFW